MAVGEQQEQYERHVSIRILVCGAQVACYVQRRLPYVEDCDVCTQHFEPFVAAALTILFRV